MPGESRVFFWKGLPNEVRSFIVLTFTHKGKPIKTYDSPVTRPITQSFLEIIMDYLSRVYDIPFNEIEVKEHD